MIKISVEGQTTLELSLKLLELGRLLAAEPVPHASEAKPSKPRKEKPSPPPEAPAASHAASAPDAAETSSPASTPTAGVDKDHQAKGVCPEAAGLALESGEFIPAENLKAPPPAEQPPAPAPAPAPADDSKAVDAARAELRTLLSGLISKGKKDAVNQLVTSYAAALSQVPADKLAELKQKAEAL